MGQPETTTDAPATKGGRRKLRAPVAGGLAFLVLLAGYYLCYVRRNTAYIEGRDFRLLATMGKQVSDAVHDQGVALRSLTRSENREQILTQFDLKLQSAPCHAAAARAHEAEDLPVLDASPDGYRLLRHAGKGKSESCVWVRLGEFLAPLFHSREAFEAVLLANGDGDDAGEVIYQQGPTELSVHRLDTLPEAAKMLALPGSDKSQNAAPDSRLRTLMSASRALDVEIGGRGFKLFLQPVLLPLTRSTTGAAAESHSMWLIGGLVPKDEILYQSLAVEPSYLAAGVVVLLLGLLGWPLLKLGLLGERQRLRAADLPMVAVCSLLGISLLTLLLLELGHRRELVRLAELQGREFARQMAANLEHEIRLADAQLRCLTKAALAKPGEEPSDQGNLLTDPEMSPLVKKYPFLESFALLYRNGQQARKWSVSKAVLPRVQVADRQYFRRALDGDLWHFPPAGDARDAAVDPAGGCDSPALTKGVVDEGGFFVDPVVSTTTGVRQAVISMPTGDPRFPVAALAAPMLSVIRPVVPPGLQFAVIEDQTGKVLFHSDAERNLAENLYDETDGNQRLRSAVFARRSASLDVRYWGDAFKASLIPVHGLPWTVVALAEDVPIEAASIESGLTAAVFLILYAAALTSLLLIVALFRPTYRADWLWPEPSRSGDYLRLTALYLLLAIGFTVAILQIRSGGKLVAIAGLIPLLALVVGYLELTRQEKPGMRRLLAGLAGASLLDLLLRAFLPAGPDRGFGTFVILPSFAVGALAWIRLGRPATRPPRRTARRAVPLSVAYPAAGAALLLLTSVLPTVAVFCMAQEIQSDCLVKCGQIELVKALASHHHLAKKLYSQAFGAGRDGLRTNPLSLDLQHLPQGEASGVQSLNFYGNAFFHTRLAHDSAGGESVEDVGGLPELLVALVPTYSAYTANARALVHDQSSDGAWRWRDVPGTRANEDYIELSSAASLPQKLWLRSSPPTSALFGEERGEASGAMGLLAAAALLLVLVSALAAFVSRRLFLVDVFEPIWSGRGGELPATLGANLLVVGREPALLIHDERFLRLDFRDLAEGSGWTDWRGDRSGRNLLVRGLEHQIADPAFNARKLEILEEAVLHRTVVIVSPINPHQLLARSSFDPAGAAGGAALAERWRTLLTSFALIDDDRWSADSSATDAVARTDHAAPFLDRECNADPLLRRIAADLAPWVGRLDRRQLLEELAERAESYYRALWSSCSDDEKVVLGHLAESGLVNEKSRGSARRLLVRGLIRRDPRFRLAGETFRRFVLSPARWREVAALEQAAGASAWDHLKRPLSGALVAGAVFFLATQKQLLDGTLAMISVGTAGIPALVKVAEFMSSRRSVRPGP